MDTKILVLLLMGVSLMAFGCAGKSAQTPTSAANDSVAGEDTMGGDMESNDSTDNGTTVEDNTSANASGKNLSDLADLFVVDTDKPIEDEGLDIETPESNES